MCAGLRMQNLRSLRKIRSLEGDRKSTRLNSSHDQISYAVFCLKKKKADADHPQGAIGAASHEVDDSTGEGSVTYVSVTGRSHASPQRAGSRSVVDAGSDRVDS